MHKRPRSVAAEPPDIMEEEPEAHHYHCTDAQFSTLAMIGTGANPVLFERVRYRPYGEAMHRFPGDFNDDSYCDSADQALLTAALNSTIEQTAYDVAIDLNRDGRINSSDQTQFNWWSGRTPLAAGRISDAGTSTAGPGPDNPYGYCGYAFNAENLLYTVRFRWYDAATGRWLERDYLRYPEGMSLYGYVFGSPISYCDPLGLFPTYAWFDPPKDDLEGEDNIMEPADNIECLESGFGWPRAGYHGRAALDDGWLLELDADLEYVGCIAKCIKKDPRRLAIALAGAGWNLTKDSLEDLIGLPGALIALVQFERSGQSISESIALDEEQLWDLMATLGEEGACAGSRLADTTVKRWQQLDDSLLEALDLWARNGANTPSDAKAYMDAWKVAGKKAARAQKWAKVGKSTHAGLKAAKGGTALLSKASGVVTTAELLIGTARELRKQCANECGGCATTQKP